MKKIFASLNHVTQESYYYGHYSHALNDCLNNFLDDKLSGETRKKLMLWDRRRERIPTDRLRTAMIEIMTKRKA